MAEPRPDSHLSTVHLNPRPDTVTSRLAKLGISIDLRLSDGTPPPAGPAVAGPRPRLDRYPIQGELGSGGMGTVLLVEDGDLGREVAAKVMHARTQGDPTQLRRFLLEAKVAGQLEHPNIVPVYELGLTASHELYFTMKRVTGRDLARRIEDIARDVADGSLDYLAAIHPLLDVFGKVCDAVAFAHDKGVVHRDLKPANVMVGRFGEVLVLDWGLAKVLGDAGADLAATAITLAFPKLVTDEERGNDLPRTLDGDVIGTPNYMPPEQAAGRVDAIDARSDIYALGAILYHVLTFHPPLHGLGTWTVIAAAGEGRIDPPSVVRTDLPIPWELDAVVRKAMAKQPDDRYASALDLKRDVERYVAGGLIKAASYSPVQLALKWARRHRLALGAAAVVVVTALVMGAVSVTSIVRARDAERSARGAAEHALAETQAARRTADAARVLAEDATASARRAGELELAAKERAQAALGATSRTLADALAYKAGLALDRGRLLDAALYVAAAREVDPSSVAALAATAGLVRSPVGLERAWDAHDAAISVVASSSDGRFATGDELGRVRIWSAADLARVVEVHELGFEVCALDFSRDGRYLIGADFGGAVGILEAATGKVLHELASARDEVDGERVADACCSPTADVACYTSSAATVEVVRLPGGEPIASLEGGEHRFGIVRFAPDGKRIAAVDETGGVWVWDVDARARVVLPDVLATDKVGALAFANATELLVCGASGLAVWDLARGTRVAGVSESEPMLLAVRALRLGAHRAAVATAEDGTLRLYDLDAGRLVAAIGADRLAPYALAVVDELRFVVGDRGGEARVWKVAPGTLQRWSLSGLALAPPAPADAIASCAVAFSANGRFAAVTRGTELGIVDLVARRRVGLVELRHPVESSAHGLAIADDGSAVAFIDDEGDLFRWDRATGRATSLARRQGGEDDTVHGFAMSSDGRRLWSAHESGQVARWQEEAGAMRCVGAWPVDEGGVLAIAVHEAPAGHTWVVVASGEELLRLDVDTGRVVRRRRIPRQGIRVLAWAPDGARFAIGGADGEIRLWDTAALEPGPVLGAHQSAISSLAWSQDGQLLASAGYEGTLALWEPTASRLLRRFEDDQEYPAALLLEGGGRRTLVAYGNGDLEVLGADPAPDLREAMRAGGLVLVGADLRTLPAKELAALGR